MYKKSYYLDSDTEDSDTEDTDIQDIIPVNNKYKYNNVNQLITNMPLLKPSILDNHELNQLTDILTNFHLNLNQINNINNDNIIDDNIIDEDNNLNEEINNFQNELDEINERENLNIRLSVITRTYESLLLNIYYIIIKIPIAVLRMSSRLIYFLIRILFFLIFTILKLPFGWMFLIIFISIIYSTTWGKYSIDLIIFIVKKSYNLSPNLGLEENIKILLDEIYKKARAVLIEIMKISSIIPITKVLSKLLGKATDVITDTVTAVGNALSNQITYEAEQTVINHNL
jgi:hypothetical protein